VDVDVDVDVVCVAVAVAKREREPHSLFQCSCFHSIWENNIGDAGAQDLGAALQVNTTLMELK
jgi:hypothetical protein